MIAAARTSGGQPLGVKTAYIAGVIPDDDSFWKIADDHGWKVRRGYLGSKNRSKQDDSWLITDLMRTLYEEQGPSTIVIVAGDADYMPPLKTALEKGGASRCSSSPRDCRLGWRQLPTNFESCQRAISSCTVTCGKTAGLTQSKSRSGSARVGATVLLSGIEQRSVAANFGRTQ